MASRLLLRSRPLFLAALGLALTACPVTPKPSSVTGSGGESSQGGGGSGNGGGSSSGQGGEGGLELAGGGGSGPCAVSCSGDLHDVVDCSGNVEKSCPADQGCGPGLECIPACDAARAAKSTVGCEYYAQAGSFFGCFGVFVVNSWSAPVSFTIDNGGASVDTAAVARIPSGNGQAITYAPLPGGALPPGEVAILFLAGSGCPDNIEPPNGFSGKPLHVVTSAPVVAYDIDPYGGGASAVTSASLLIPTSAWDTNYVAVQPWPYGPNSQNPRLTITASENETKVTINPVADIASGMLAGGTVPGTLANTPATYTLQKGDALSFEQESELTGSAILSDKPIGVLGSSGCINIGPCCCDGAHQQIPPVRALGSDYLAVRYRNRVEGMEETPPWRIVGAVDGTILSYDPPVAGAPTTLGLGQILSFEAAGPFRVKSQDEDHPFYLAGYMTGGGDFEGAGDPEFVNVIPARQYLSSYTFFADPTYPETDLILVRSRAKDGTFKDVTLDCAGAIPGWQPIGASGEHEYTRFDLVRGNFVKQGNCDNGRREIKSDAPFGLTVWGWGTTATEPGFVSTYVSYAYPAGARVQPINDVVVLPEPK